MGYIYILTNIENGKQYVGKTEKDVSKRIKRHFNDSNSQSQCLIHRAIRKYGMNSFVLDTHVFPDHQLNDMEIFYIRHLCSKTPNGYNMTDGGDGGSGRICSEETKNKTSKTLTGKKHTEERKFNNSKAHMGFKPSKETRKKISVGNTGKHHSEEAKIKISMSQTGKIISDETKIKLSLSHCKKKYVVIFPDSHIEEVVSIRCFCKKNNLCPTSIYNLINGRYKQHKGFRIYVKENINE